MRVGAKEVSQLNIEGSKGLTHLSRSALLCLEVGREAYLFFSSVKAFIDILQLSWE